MSSFVISFVQALMIGIKFVVEQASFDHEFERSCSLIRFLHSYPKAPIPPSPPPPPPPTPNPLPLPQPPARHCPSLTESPDRRATL